MNKQLELVRQLQDEYPSLALGGSLGLFLHGIRIRSDYSTSDLDFTSKHELPDQERNQKTESADMDYAFTREGIAVDIQVDPSIESILISHEGWLYRVSTVAYIMRHKMRYAMLGYDKHISDVKQIAAQFDILHEIWTRPEIDLPF